MIKKAVDDAIIKQLHKLTTKAKQKAHDPYMYKQIQSLVDDTVDEVCAFAEEEVIIALRKHQMEPYVVVESTSNLGCIGKIRAFHNYTCFPHNKT